MPSRKNKTTPGKINSHDKENSNNNTLPSLSSLSLLSPLVEISNNDVGVLVPRLEMLYVYTRITKAWTVIDVENRESTTAAEMSTDNNDNNVIQWVKSWLLPPLIF